MKPGKTANDAPVFELKGSIMTILVLHIRKTETEVLYPQLEKKMGQAQAFFKNAPVLIDLSEADEEQQAALDFVFLAATLRRLGTVPVGVRGAAPSQSERIVQAGLGLLPAIKAERTVAPSAEKKPAEEKAQTVPARPEQPARIQQPEPVVTPTRVVAYPVRSGQQVFAPQGDLIILSSVNAGAEVLAAGNIHIYGALRGRAMAGINGDTTARIFSLQCNPELVAVAGEYMVNESLKEALLNKSVMISLEESGLKFEVVGSFAPSA